MGWVGWVGRTAHVCFIHTTTQQVIWQVDFQLGRSAILFWNVLFFIGNAMKDLLCLPRPLNPPVLCLEKEYSAE